MPENFEADLKEITMRLQMSLDYYKKGKLKNAWVQLRIADKRLGVVRDSLEQEWLEDDYLTRVKKEQEKQDKDKD